MVALRLAAFCHMKEVKIIIYMYLVHVFGKFLISDSVV